MRAATPSLKDYPEREYPLTSLPLTGVIDLTRQKILKKNSKKF